MLHSGNKVKVLECTGARCYCCHTCIAEPRCPKLARNPQNRSGLKCAPLLYIYIYIYIYIHFFLNGFGVEYLDAAPADARKAWLVKLPKAYLTIATFPPTESVQPSVTMTAFPQTDANSQGRRLAVDTSTVWHSELPEELHESEVPDTKMSSETK